MINDKSQGSVATDLGCSELFRNHFTTNLSFCLLLKEFLKLANVWARWMIVSHALFALQGLQCAA